MERIGIGMLGCGEIARRRYIPLIMRARDAEITAVCTSSRETAERAAQHLRVPFWTSDVEEFLQRPEVDAVVVCTPHRLHARQAAAALHAGKHVLVEKPMATDWPDAEHLIEAASGAGRVAMILPWEHNAELNAMISCLDTGTIGRLVAVTADFSGPGAPPGRDWKYSLGEAGGGVIVAHAVYALDLIASIMGPASRVAAFANTLIGKRTSPDGTVVKSDIEDNAVVLLEYDTGQHAVVRSCWAYPGKQRNLVLQGTRGCVMMASGGVFVTPPVPGGTTAVDSVYHAREKLGRVPLSPDTESIVDHFLRCIRTGAEPAANLEQAAHVTEQMMAAYESVKSGAAQTLSTSFQPRHSLARHD